MIAGTLGFLRKEQYAIALALMVSDMPALGVLGCPNLPLRLAEPSGAKGCVLVAVRGQGATMAALTEGATETPVHCSQETDPSVRTLARTVHLSLFSDSVSLSVAEHTRKFIDAFCQRVVHTTSVESGHSFADVTNTVTQAMGIVQAPIKFDSQVKVCPAKIVFWLCLRGTFIVRGGCAWRRKFVPPSVRPDLSRKHLGPRGRRDHRGGGRWSCVGL